MAKLLHYNYIEINTRQITHYEFYICIKRSIDYIKRKIELQPGGLTFSFHNLLDLSKIFSSFKPESNPVLQISIPIEKDTELSDILFRYHKAEKYIYDMIDVLYKAYIEIADNKREAIEIAGNEKVDNSTKLIIKSILEEE
jgi:hypothetical protein